MTIDIEFSEAEVLALAAIAGEGAAGLLTDKAAARAYVGDARAQEAARSALQKVEYAAVDVRAWKAARKRIKEERKAKGLA